MGVPGLVTYPHGYTANNSLTRSNSRLLGYKSSFQILSLSDNQFCRKWLVDLV